MIGTIRKHSAWLWVFIITLTIISFVYWGAAPATRNGSAAAGSFGTLYGREVTREDYLSARAEFSIDYWLRNREWPSALTEQQINREVYWRLMFARKAAELGIHVSDDQVARVAANILLNLGRNARQPVTMDQMEALLNQQKFTLDDFKHALAGNLATEQLEQLKGMAGNLVTPQEISEAYDHDHAEYSAEAVFFEATNYLTQVAVPPGAAGQFFTNYMAMYREPERVQINYVFFGTSNYLAQAKEEWAKTNFEAVVNATYTQNMADFADAKSPEEAKAKVRAALVERRAMIDALQAAREFATPVFNEGKAESLAAVAAQKGLAVHTTLPFSAAEGPVEFAPSQALVKEAFKLDADTPLAGPVQTSEGFYVIGLARKVPSGFPAFEQIRDRVTADLKDQQAVGLAQRAGTNFYYQTAVTMAAGQTFAQAAAAGGYRPQALPAFSLSTEELTELGDRNTFEAVKEAAYSTPAGRISPFVPLASGGFVLHAKALLPVDAAKKAADLPAFASQFRRERMFTAFNLWLQGESVRELSNIPLLKEKTPSASQ